MPFIRQRRMRDLKTLQKIFALLAVVLVLPGTSHAASDGLVRLSETGDYEPIQAEIPDLVPALNGVLQEEGLPAIDEADIDLSKAYPFYPADGFFASEITTAEAFEAQIRAQKDFVWYVPVEVPGRLMIVGMAREENGEWGCASVEFCDAGDSLADKVQRAGIEADRTYLVGALPGSGVVMAVCIRDGALAEVVCLTQAEITVEGMDDESGVQTVTLEENQSWTYPQMQELLAHVKIEGLAEYDIRAAVAAAVALLIGAACVVIRIRKRRKQRQERDV